MTSNLCPIGLGTYKLIGEDCIRIISQAIKCGYRTIDTAVLYKNHKEICEGIKLSKIDRSELYISSKIHDSTQKNGKIIESVEEILAELETDYLDQLLLHSAVKNKYLNAWKQLERLYKEGKVKHIGVSNFHVNELEDLLSHCEIKPYLNQFEISPFCTRKNLVKYCFDNDIKVQAYGSLTVGRKLADPNLAKIAAKLNVTPQYILLKWAMQKGYYIIPKSECYEHLTQNLMPGDKSNPDIPSICMDELDELNEDYYTINKHRD